MSNSLPISDADERVFRELRQLHLRHPRMVKSSIVKLFNAEFLSAQQIGNARLEWLKLTGGQS